MTPKELTKKLHDDLNKAYAFAIDLSNMIPALGIRIRVHEIVTQGHDDITREFIRQLETTIIDGIKAAKQGALTGPNTLAGLSAFENGLGDTAAAFERLDGFKYAFDKSPAARLMLHCLLVSSAAAIQEFTKITLSATINAVDAIAGVKTPDPLDAVRNTISENVDSMMDHAIGIVKNSAAVVNYIPIGDQGAINDIVEVESRILCSGLLSGVTNWTAVMGSLISTRGFWVDYIIKHRAGGDDD